MSAAVSGQTIRLTPAPSSAAYEEGIEDVLRELYFVRDGTHCDGRQIPRTVVLLHRAHEALAREVRGINVPSIENLGGQDRCGDAVAFFGEYLR